MSILGLIKKMPDYAEDLKLNLEQVFVKTPDIIDLKDLYGIALSVGYSLGYETLLNDIRAEAKMFLTDIEANACKTASIVMAMANVYYHFCDSDCTEKRKESNLF